MKKARLTQKHEKSILLFISLVDVIECDIKECRHLPIEVRVILAVDVKTQNNF